MALAQAERPTALPDHPYARELRDGVPRLRFAPDVERDFIKAHLNKMRSRVRAWTVLMGATTTALAVGLLTQSLAAPPFIFWLHIMGLLPCAIAQCWLAWSRYYDRWYMTIAPILVPIPIAMAAILTAAGTDIRDNNLAALTLNVTASFFFCGLLFRSALFCILTILVIFPAAALYFGMTTFELAGNAILLTLTGGICAYVARDTEQSFRKNFLEDAMIADLVARDGLTGLANRRSFDDHLLRVWQHSQRDGRTIAILMVDIDNFKVFNDTYGHQGGDAAIRCVAQLMGGFARRPLDIAARYGGEEFAIILYDLQVSRVQEAAEGIRQAVQAASPIYDHGAAPLPRVTVSIGAGIVTPTIGRTPAGAIQLADEALYEAKHQGRNRVVTKSADDYGVLRTGAFRSPSHARKRR